MNKKACIICDIDGVYADSREWCKFVPKRHDDRAGWDEFAKHADTCKPNPVMIAAITMLSKVFPILFVTSRESTPELREITMNQITDFSGGKIKLGEGSHNKLFMRKYEDYRRSYIVKEEILDEDILPNYFPILAIDDDKGNVNMFRRKGIATKHYTDIRSKG